VKVGAEKKEGAMEGTLTQNAFSVKGGAEKKEGALSLTPSISFRK